MIRQIEERDINVWRSMVADYDAKIGAVSEIAWARIRDGGCFNCDVFDVGGEILGFVQYVTHPTFFHIAPVWYLSDLYVKPEHRKKGVARSLIEHVLTKSKSHGAERVYWVTEAGSPIGTFYEGFSEGGWLRYHVDSAAPDATKEESP